MSPRQEKILSAIVEQYAEVASPVGSSLLAKVFNVSSATIRADMAQLEGQGYIPIYKHFAILCNPQHI